MNKDTIEHTIELMKVGRKSLVVRNLDTMYWDHVENASEAHFASVDRITHPEDVDYLEDVRDFSMFVAETARDMSNYIAERFGA